MRETASPEKIRHLCEEVGRAAADLETARQTLATKRQQLAEAACPWRPGDFVRQAVATVPEIPLDQRYRVIKIHPGDPNPTAPNVWALEVRDRVGNSFIFAATVQLAPAEPWEEEPRG